MLSNAYFVAKFRFDKAENEPAKNLQKNSNLANFANLANLANVANLEVVGQADAGPRVRPAAATAAAVPSGGKPGAAKE